MKAAPVNTSPDNCFIQGNNITDSLSRVNPQARSLLGADFWSSDSNIGKYTTFVPNYIGPPLTYKDVN